MEHIGKVLMEKYELGRLLGKGTFAKVYHARDLRSGQSVAIKIFDKEKIMRVGLVAQIKREISVMRMVKHPNIVQLFEVMASKSKIYFVLEYAKGGELFQKIAKGKLPEDVVHKYFQQLISAVDYCHSRGVYHRDLKPENLLLDSDENLKVSDFGLSALVDSRKRDGLLHTTCGTPAYVAPEVISRTGYDGAKADVWSCGVILFVLLAGYLPFYDSNLMAMYRKIEKGQFKCPSWFPSDVRKLIYNILDPNPNTRISIERIKENKWFKKGYVDKSLKTGGADTQDHVPVDVNAAFDSSCSSTSEGMPESKCAIADLNAFDIISLSTGFDLSGLFVGGDHRKEARFTSRGPASIIISKLEKIGKHLMLKVSKKADGVLKIEGSKEGKKGVLSMDAEIYQVTPSFHFVQIKKTNGDTLEYEKVLKEGIRPALKDIVWTWQGDGQSQQQ